MMRIKPDGTVVSVKPSRQKMRCVFNKLGQLVATIPVHYRAPTASDLKRLHTGPRPGVRVANEGVPVNHGTHSRSEQYEFMTHKGRSVRSVGSMLLQSLTVAAQQVGPGVRLYIQPIFPAALGEMLTLLAQTFEQNKIHRLRFVYRSAQPATVAGSVAMYFRKDLNTAMVTVGIDELRHASTHSNYVDGQIWESFSCEPDPADTLQKYFNEENGEISFTMEGLFTFLTASDCSAITTTLGNLYLEYDIEFFDEELDYLEGATYAGILSFGWGSTGTAKMAGDTDALFFPSYSSSQTGEYCNPAADLVPPNANFGFYGVLLLIDTSGGPVPNFYTQDSAGGGGDATVRSFAVGQGFYFGSNSPGSTNFGDGSISIAATTDPGGLQEVVNYYPSNATYKGRLVFSVFAYPLSE